jgi:GntR family transcriptional regulator
LFGLIHSGDSKEKSVSTSVDRRGRLPIYHQIALSIQQRIASEEWPVGGKLPNEHDLARHYEVSRVTIRQALTELEKDGIVVRKRPSGTFVERMPERLTPNVSVMVDILHSLSSVGHSIDIKTLVIELVEEGPAEARVFLNMQPDEPFVMFKRFIAVNGAPFAWVQTFASSNRFPNLEKTPLRNNSLQETIFDAFGIKAESADHWIEANRATEDDVTVLGIGEDRLILNVVSLFSDQNGQPMAYMSTRWLADMMRLQLKSTTSNPLIDLANSSI